MGMKTEDTQKLMGIHGLVALKVRPESQASSVCEVGRGSSQESVGFDRRDEGGHFGNGTLVCEREKCMYPLRSGTQPQSLDVGKISCVMTLCSLLFRDDSLSGSWPECGWHLIGRREKTCSC